MAVVLNKNPDFKMLSSDVTSPVKTIKQPWWQYIKFLITGILFGIVLVKAQVISWFRIQEMFRLQSFHMYGVIGSAVVTGIISIQIIKRFNIKTINGETISLPQKNSVKARCMAGYYLVWLGAYRCMPGTCICINWQRRFCNDYYFTKRYCGHMGIWVAA